MHDLNLHALDLNLLVTLEALITSRSVGRAASIAGLSQSAMSRSLGRLREMFDDELLVRAGNQMIPTARAQALLGDLRHTLNGVRSMITGQRTAPQDYEGVITILMTDHGGRLWLPGLLAAVGEKAPKLNLAIRHPGPFPTTSLQNGDADLWVDVLTPDATPLETAELFEDPYRCMVRREHPLADGVNLERWAAAKHGVVNVRGWGGSEISRLAEAEGHPRRVAITIPTFGLAADLVQTSDLVFTLPSRLVQSMARQYDLVTFPPPLDVPPLPVGMAWHRRTDADPRLEWLRARVLGLCA